MAGTELVNETIHVLSVLHLSERHLAQLRSVSPRLVVHQHPIVSEEQWLRAAEQQFAELLRSDMEILYTHTAPFDLRLTPRLRWVQVDSAGVNLLYNTPLWLSDIPITSANGIHAALIDQNALIVALQERRLGGVALDVTEPEPLPANSPLWIMDNVIITPHISGLSTHYNDRIADLFSENLRRYLNGESFLNTVQRELGY